MTKANLETLAKMQESVLSAFMQKREKGQDDEKEKRS
jgi:hypothetical protein